MWNCIHQKQQPLFTYDYIWDRKTSQLPQPNLPHLYRLLPYISSAYLPVSSLTRLQTTNNKQTNTMLPTCSYMIDMICTQQANQSKSQNYSMGYTNLESIVLHVMTHDSEGERSVILTSPSTLTVSTFLPDHGS